MSLFGLPIDAQAVQFLDDAATKRDSLVSLAEALGQTGAVTDADAFLRAVLERESVMSTGIGDGVAIPHVRTPAVSRPAVGVGVSRGGIEFDTLDNRPVHVVVLFGMPPNSQKEYLKLLAQVMMQVKEPDFLERVLACTSREELDAALDGGGHV